MHPTKKKHRVSSFNRLSSVSEQPSSSMSEQNNGSSNIDYQFDSKTKISLHNSIQFNDSAEANVMLFLHSHQSESASCGNPETTDSSLISTKVFLHSWVLEQCPYFATILSERWKDTRQFSEGPDNQIRMHINITVPPSRSINSYLQVLELLYHQDFQKVIKDVTSALSCLPVAAEWLYDECITACVQFLEAVPWTEEEEKKVLELVTTLQLKESAQLLARVLPVNATLVEDMLAELVYAATHSHPNGATVKAFVAGLLNNHGSRSTVKAVLDSAFASSLKIVKDSIEEYSSPNVRGRHDEIEALQRMSLHTASVNGKHLLWLVERMIELKVADNAVTEWSEQSVFTANLQRAFTDDAWRSIAPGLLTLVLRCTWRLALAVSTGTILAPCQVRLNFVKCWLPVLLVSRDSPVSTTSWMKLLQDLEDVFLRIISTLPLKDAQGLLTKCLGFATRSVLTCPHLVAAFDMWFRRAGTEREEIRVVHDDEDGLSEKCVEKLPVRSTDEDDGH